MPKTDNLQKLGLFLLLWLIVIPGSEANAQRRGPSPEQIFGYMDRNKNGRIDPDEIENSRGPFKEMLQRAGVDYRRGLDQRSFSSAFEKIRQQRESGDSDRDRGRDRDRDDDDRRRRDDDDRRRQEYEKRKREEEERRRRENSNSSSKKAAPVIKPKPRVTVDMPSTFAEGDRDTDGQIGFYEWKKWKRDSISDFVKYDHNRDGFLTPRELEKGPNEAVVIVSPTRPVMTGPSVAETTQPKTSPSITTTVSSEAKPESSEPTFNANSVTARRAESMFRLLDKDRDDRLTGEEWNRSRTIKPLFEKGGVDLSQPMSKNDFLTNYVRLSDS